MPKQLIIDQIEINQLGNIHVRYTKMSSDGDMIGYHRTAVDALGDVQGQLDAVNTHMAKDGYLPPDNMSLVTELAAVAWTDKNLTPVAKANIAAKVESFKAAQAQIDAQAGIATPAPEPISVAPTLEVPA